METEMNMDLVRRKKKAVRRVNFQVSQENWQLRSLCEVKTQFKMKVKYTAFEIKKKTIRRTLIQRDWHQKLVPEVL